MGWYGPRGYLNGEAEKPVVQNDEYNKTKLLKDFPGLGPSGDEMSSVISIKSPSKIHHLHESKIKADEGSLPVGTLVRISKSSHKYPVAGKRPAFFRYVYYTDDAAKTVYACFITEADASKTLTVGKMFSNLSGISDYTYSLNGPSDSRSPVPQKSGRSVGIPPVTQVTVKCDTTIEESGLLHGGFYPHVIVSDEIYVITPIPSPYQGSNKPTNYDKIQIFVLGKSKYETNVMDIGAAYNKLCSYLKSGGTAVSWGPFPTELGALAFAKTLLPQKTETVAPLPQASSAIKTIKVDCKTSNINQSGLFHSGEAPAYILYTPGNATIYRMEPYNQYTAAVVSIYEKSATKPKKQLSPYDFFKAVCQESEAYSVGPFWSVGGLSIVGSAFKWASEHAGYNPANSLISKAFKSMGSSHNNDIGPYSLNGGEFIPDDENPLALERQNGLLARISGNYGPVKVYGGVDRFVRSDSGSYVGALRNGYAVRVSNSAGKVVSGKNCIAIATIDGGKVIFGWIPRESASSLSGIGSNDIGPYSLNGLVEKPYLSKVRIKCSRAWTTPYEILKNSGLFNFQTPTKDKGVFLLCSNAGCEAYKIHSLEPLKIAVYEHSEYSFKIFGVTEFYEKICASGQGLVSIGPFSTVNRAFYNKTALGLSGINSNDIGPYSLNAETPPVTTEAPTTLSVLQTSGIAAGALLTGLGLGYFFFKKK